MVNFLKIKIPECPKTITRLHIWKDDPKESLILESHNDFDTCQYAKKCRACGLFDDRGRFEIDNA